MLIAKEDFAEIRATIGAYWGGPPSIFICV